MTQDIKEALKVAADVNDELGALGESRSGTLYRQALAHITVLEEAVALERHAALTLATAHRHAGAALQSSSRREAAAVGALRELIRMERGIKADLRSAHYGRGDGASEWMREDDRDFRKDFDALCDQARSALQGVEHRDEPLSQEPKTTPQSETKE